MIHTTVSQMQKYIAVHPLFGAAFDALRKLEKESFVKGRHAVDGEKIYINAIEYDTKQESAVSMEAHRAYIDVMLLLEGEERIGYCQTEQLSNITKEYSDAGDALLAELEADCSWVTMTSCDVVIFFPEDAHAPGAELNGQKHIRKLIAKVAVE